MEPSVRNALLSVVHRLCSRPLFQTFRGKVKYKVQEQQEEMQILSLKMIIADLESGNISSISAFESKMDLWFKLKSHKMDRMVRTCLSDLRRGYEKGMIQVKWTDDRAMWMNHCENIRGRVDKLLDGAPPVAVFRKIDRQLDAGEIDFILRAIRRVMSPVDILKVCQILGDDPAGAPENRPAIVVDLSLLQNSTRCRLFDFLKQRFTDDPVKF